ncbi:MAG TPA: HAD family phosphatase [Solirubrobacteraceae bacterium]|nr:HAD family phosphatase [Solirubrobacteraceae bacterium]
MRPAAVVFDLDGVLIDSEGVWNTARREVALAQGGHWSEGAQRAMMGMSSTEWSAYMHDRLAVELPPERISEIVVSKLLELYRHEMPLLPGAVEAVDSLSEVWPLGLASSANRPVIELVLSLSGLWERFAATVSSEEVPHGKPAPDVYLQAARELDVPAEECVAVEDSANGIRSAAAAQMSVIAVPNREFPPSAGELELADDVLGSLQELDRARVEWAAAGA